MRINRSIQRDFQGGDTHTNHQPVEEWKILDKKQNQK